MSFKDTFFWKMLSENGEPSSKRWIAATVAAALVWGIVYSLMKASNASERYAVLVATMFFVLTMAGVTTLPQIVSLIKGTPPPKDDEPKN